MSVGRCVLRRSRGELSNETLITKFGIDTSENEPEVMYTESAVRIQRTEREESVRGGSLV